MKEFDLLPYYGRFCLLFLLLVFCHAVFAQQKTGTVKGLISDASGPLPGASVIVSGTTTGTKTDNNGNYSISLAEGTYTLSVSFIGYKKLQSKEVMVTAGQQTVHNLTMDGGTQLKEVQVTYGKQKQREVTGSIAQLDAAQLQDMPVNQFAQQLQGKVAGVQVSQTSGQPGQGMAFRIRGAASLLAGSQPLFVVDGIPITGSINNINPTEIETFTVLKDASSTALYGSRAANGVILITTKHAKNGDSKIDFSSNYGIQKIPAAGIPRMMTAREFAEFQNEYYQDRVKYEGYTGQLDPAYANLERYGDGVNWFNTLTRTAPIQSYDLSVLSGREKSSSAVVAGYMRQDGVVINNNTQLFSLRINQDLSLGDKVKVGFNVAPSYRIDHNNRLGANGLGGFVQRIVEGSPLIQPQNPDGSFPLYVNSPGMVANVNPYAQLLLTKADYKTTRILGNAYLNYEFLKGLSLKTNLAVDKGAETYNLFSPSTISTTAIATGQSGSVDNFSWTGEANLQYNKSFGEHNLEALVGYSAQKFEEEGNSVSGQNFPSDDIAWLSGATSISGGTSNTTQFSLLSTIGRVNYNYKGRYLLSAAIRRDGSSRFGLSRKYGSFPSISAGWIISDEAFMKKYDKINLLKVRASYGITGNNDIGNFTHISTIGAYNYVLNGVLVPGNSINVLGNPNLGWERNKQLDIGFDLALFNNRISLTYDYYNKISDGLIQDRPIPQASGFGSVKFNVGVFKFWGHEIGLATTNLTGKLKWNSNFNISFDRNVIKSLVDPGFIRRTNSISDDYYRNQVGHRLGEFYGFVFQGLYKDEQDLANSPKYGSASDVGTIKMKDINGDGVIDDVNDRTFIGDPTPDFTFGFTNDFRYKKFDLNITMSGSVGGQILAASKWPYLANLDGARMLLAAVKDRWRSPENPGSGVYPRTKTGTTALGRQVNSQWLEDGSYLTVKNISLGYSFDLSKAKMLLKNLRVYASVQQAFVITGYSGFNPEIGLNGLNAASGIGVDENSYPVPRTFSIGISTSLK